MAHDVDLAPSQLWFCTAIVTILFTSSMCSTFFILSMPFERCYSIIRPHKAASFNTVTRAKITIIFIIIFSIVYNLPSWFVTAQDGQVKKLCSLWLCYEFTSWPDLLLDFKYLEFHFAFHTFIIMNTVIINTLSKRSKQITRTRGHCQSQGQSQGQVGDHCQKSKNSETQISVTLLLVTFSYLILNSPTYVYIFLIVAEVEETDCL